MHRDNSHWDGLNPVTAWDILTLGRPDLLTCTPPAGVQPSNPPPLPKCRWGTQSDNKREHNMLKRFYELRDALPPHLRQPFVRHVHPARCMLFAQGFWPRSRIFPDVPLWQSA